MVMIIDDLSEDLNRVINDSLEYLDEEVLSGIDDIGNLNGEGSTTILNGSPGDDNLRATGSSNATVTGGSGNDVISTGDGDDVLDGGPGQDRLSGGPGDDVFRFTTPEDSSPGTQRDIITDFEPGDRIDLSMMDADTTQTDDQSFRFIGIDPFTGAGQVRYYNENGNTIAAANIDTDPSADFEVMALGITPLSGNVFEF